MSFAADLFSAAGRTAVITGGGAGLGYWMAETWVKNGGRVYINGRREEPLKQAVAKLNVISKDSAFYAVADVATKEGVEKLAREVASRETSLDVLVNNAGIGLFDSQEPGAILPTFDPDAWSQLFSLNAWSPAAVTSAFAPLLVEAAKKGEGRGSVILISSIADSMWFAATPMTGKADKLVPMKRNGNAEDISGAFLFLATKASAYMTGQKFAVDGGWSLIVNGRS
ncbi:NAD(P)-binding protein [Dentipellis sp. KUC8613]|nr:NAD(P)-binding protein [Dentipellis sp. KUC8613]